MNFNGYQEVESSQVKDGDYRAKILSTTVINRNGYEILSVKLHIEHCEGMKPDEISFFDRPHESEKAEKWDYSMTKFFDSFGIKRGNFNINSWIGKIGIVTVKPQKNDAKYKVIYPKCSDDASDAVSEYNEEEEEKPKQSFKQKSYKQEQLENEFPDDIPF